MRCAAVLQHLAHRREIAGMHAPMQPANDAFAIEERRAGQLRGVFHPRRAPILPESRGLIDFAAFAQRAIAEEPPEIVVFQAHGLVRTLSRIRNALRRIAETRTEFPSQFLRPNHDKAHGDAGRVELVFDLAQLRERFTEKRSTDVPQPDDERGQRHAQRSHGPRHR